MMSALPKSPTHAVAAVGATTLVVVAACSTAEPPQAESCLLDPPGKAFTFVIRNVGTRMLHLTYGCGSNPPIALETADGTFGIGAESAEDCGTTCEYVYGGSPNVGCSDCGPGEGASLDPGETVTLVWDRRVRVPHLAPESCAPAGVPQYERTCARPVLAESASKGTLRICTEGGFAGMCSTSELRPFSFDPTLDSVTIEVE